MAFWGVEVKPGRPFTHKVSDARRRLHVSQATLGVGNATKKSIVQCNVGEKSPVFLCSLSPEKVESCQLNLEFEEAVEVIFSVIGPRSVHLTGYYLNVNQNFMANDSSETYGEDIEDTEEERSSSKNDYDYSDSFIDDGNPKASQNSSILESDDELTLKERADGKKNKRGNGKRGRLRKKYQVSDSDAEENWKLGAFSGADDSGSGDSQKLDDTEIEHEVQKLPSSKSDLFLRHKTSKARETSPSEMGEIDFKSKKTSREHDHNACEATNESDIKSSGNILASLKEGHETLSKKKKKKEVQERTVGGQQNSSDGAQNDNQAIDSGVKSLGDILPSSTKEGCETLSKKKRKKKGHEGTVEDSSVVEGGKGPQNLSEGIQNQNQANRGIKSSGNIMASLEDGSGTPLKKKRKKEAKLGPIDVNSCVEGDNVLQNLSQHAENGQQAIEKKTSKVQSDDDTSKLDCPPLFSKENIKRESGDNGYTSSDRKASELETLSKGLMIEELDKGNLGGKSAAKGKKVSIIYTGKLKENGQVFDSNVGKDPLRFRLGSGKVIEGLDIGIEGMQIGDKRRFIIPPSLGSARKGSMESVPVNSWLVYDVEVVKAR